MRRGAAAVNLANAILAYAMAGAFVLWLIGENREEGSRILRLVSAAIVALVLVGEDREYQWWISGFVLVELAAVSVIPAKRGTRRRGRFKVTGPSRCCEPPSQLNCIEGGRW